MYKYNEFDEAFVRNRVAEFREQVERRIDGSLTEDEFKPLRLKNGLYLQLHAYMLRVAIPYGTLNSTQMRQLALIAERLTRATGISRRGRTSSSTGRKLKDVPEILDLLADVEMHAIQTSGNCIRNVTADHFAGAAADEIEDPRPTAELLRQWSTDHPEFQFLPRKFKIAVTGAPNDRAVTKAHDIGLRMVSNEAGEPGYEVIVGGGLGRTPMVGKTVREFLPKADLLPYLEAIMQVYNLSGRRDNKYKARIKILVHETGLEEIRARGRGGIRASQARDYSPARRRNWSRRLRRRFAPPAVRQHPDRFHSSTSSRPIRRSAGSRPMSAEHKNPAYGIVSVRSSRSAARRAMRPPSRCASWPISPSASAMTKSASATSRM